MNKKELATLVYKHKLIQEIIKKNIFNSSIVSQIIVEEVDDEDLPTITAGGKKLIELGQITAFKAAIMKEPESYKRILTNIEKQNLYLPPKAAEDLKKTYEQSLEVNKGKNSQTEKEKVEKEAEQLKDEDKKLLNKFVSFVQSGDFLQESLGDVINDLGIEDTSSFGKKFGRIFNREEIQKIVALLKDNEEARELVKSQLADFVRQPVEKPPEKEVTSTEPVQQPQGEEEPQQDTAVDTDTDTDTEEQPDTTPEKEKVKQATEEAIKEENVESDFDQSNPEIPNLRYDEYRNSLDWFFGMREDKKTSFMKAFFLSFQVDLLHNHLLASLNNIKSPPNFGERALTRDAAQEQPETTTQPEEVIQEQQETEETIQLSRKNKVALKRELADQADILLDAKKIAEAYKDYGTQKSLDAQFDGSSLEKQLKIILGEVQKHNARLVAVISNISNDYKKIEETLQEQELSRDQKIDEIEKVYKQMGNFYKNNLRVSLENKEFEKAVQGADKMLDMVKPIIQFFPKTIVHSTSGKIITLSDAIQNLNGKIQSYKKVLRDIYMNVKDNEVSPIQLSRMLIQITQLCESIDSQFDVPCMINEREKKNAENNLPEKQGALSSGITLPEPSGELDDEEEETEAFPPQTGGTGEESRQINLKTILTQLELPQIRQNVGIERDTEEAEGLRFLAIALAAQELGSELPRIAGFNEDRSRPRKQFELNLQKLGLNNNIEKKITSFMTDFAKQRLPEKSVLKRGYNNALKLLDNKENFQKVKNYLNTVYDKILNLKKDAKTFNYTGPESLVQQTTGVDLLDTLEEKLEPIIEQMLRGKNG